MIGRAAQGNPWIFREIAHFLATGETSAADAGRGARHAARPSEALHAFYGEPQGVRIARKHLGWYAKDHPESAAFRATVNAAETPGQQIRHHP
jgi:tRNA-dihydrouridine synthase B